MDKEMWIAFIRSWKIYGMYLKSLWIETVLWNRRKLPLRDLKAATPGKADCLKLLCVSIPSSITLILNVNFCVTSIVSISYKLWVTSHRISEWQGGFQTVRTGKNLLFSLEIWQWMKECSSRILWCYAQLYLERGEFCLGLCRC